MTQLPISSYISPSHDIFPHAPSSPYKYYTNVEQIHFWCSTNTQIQYCPRAHSPALPMIARSPAITQSQRAFYPKITHRLVGHRQDNPLLRPTCDPYLWRPLYLKLWCQIQIHLQYSQKILENHSAIQLSSSSNHFWTASDISCKQVLKIHSHHIPKLRGPNLCNGVNIVTYITK